MGPRSSRRMVLESCRQMAPKCSLPMDPKVGRSLQKISRFPHLRAEETVPCRTQAVLRTLGAARRGSSRSLQQRAALTLAVPRAARE